MRHRSRGMNILELALLLLILGLIVLAVASAVIPSLHEARRERTQQDLRNLELALKLFHKKHGHFPDAASGFRALVEAGVLEQDPRDPWGNDYLYRLEDGGPVILSQGADGRPGGEGQDADSSRHVPSLAESPPADAGSPTVR